MKKNKTEKNYKAEQRKIALERKREQLIKHLELTIEKYEEHIKRTQVLIDDATQRGSHGDLRIFTAKLKSQKVFVQICKGKIYLLNKIAGMTKSEEQKKKELEDRENISVLDDSPENED
jgi:hypothetical protein